MEGSDPGGPKTYVSDGSDSGILTKIQLNITLSQGQDVGSLRKTNYK